MTTTIVHSIGTAGRDYSTVNAWVAACPTDLVAVDQIWHGECYNDSEFTDTLTVSGITSSAACYPILTCATGHSFTDNVNKLTNALRYDIANGVGFRVQGNYRNQLTFDTSFFKVKGVQFFYDTSYPSSYFKPGGMFGSNQRFSECLFQSRRDGGQGYFMGNASSSAVNCVSILLGGGSRAISATGNCALINMTLIRPADLPAAGFGVYYDYPNSPLMQNVVVLGPFGECFKAITYSAQSSNNVSSDASAPGVNSLLNVPVVTELTNAASLTLDVRPAATSVLAGAGVRVQAYTNDLDIMAQPRSLTAPTPGAWEIAGSVSGSSPLLRNMQPVIGPILAQ